MPFVRIAAQILWLAVLTAIPASSLSAQPSPDSSSSTSGPAFRHQVEKETFVLVNQYRVANQLPPLVWDVSIAKVARAHSEDMAAGEVDFGHGGFRERIGRLSAVMNGFRGAGENVFMTTNLDEVAQTAVTMWLRSAHHLQNIRGDYNYSGLGVWQTRDGTIYFTQIFVRAELPIEATQAAPAAF